MTISDIFMGDLLQVQFVFFVYICICHARTYISNTMPWFKGLRWEMRGDWLFCWYRWDCWPLLLLQLSFHNDYHTWAEPYTGGLPASALTPSSTVGYRWCCSLFTLVLISPVCEFIVKKLFISPDVMVYKISGLLTADGTVAETCPTDVPLATFSSMVNLYVCLSNTGGWELAPVTLM